MSRPFSGVMRAACTLTALAALSGCSSAYIPARSPRATLVMDSGSPRVIRDGEDKGGFSFGGGVVDAVQGNPRAEREARLGRNLVVAGFAISLTGLVTEVSGVVYTIDNRQHSGTGLGITLAGGILAVVGTVMALNGQPHLYDAVNIYNDDLERGPRVERPPTLPYPSPPLLPGPPPPPPGAAAPGSAAPKPGAPLGPHAAPPLTPGAPAVAPGAPSRP